MKIGKWLIFILIFVSCKEENKHQIITTDLEMNWEEVKFGKGTKIENSFLESTFGEFENLNIICQIISPEHDSLKLREYNLLLFEGFSNKKIQRVLATISPDNELIDFIVYDDENWKLRNIYTHSSDFVHDGVAVEFIEDRTTGKNISIYRNVFEIFETGIIEKIQPKFDGIEVHKKLKSTKKYTGMYEYSKDSFEFKLDLKDGIIENTYAFKFNQKTPLGCKEEAHNLKREFRFDGTDTISDFLLSFYNNKIELVNEDMESFCKEPLKKNIELKKKN